MIDLHTHVLPGIDDGASNTEESLAMLETAADDGIEVVAATPHARDDYPDLPLRELPERCAELVAMRPPGALPQLVPGAEVDLAWAQSASDEELRLASLAQRGHTVLVETPYAPLTPSFEGLLFQLQARGFQVLLAHPERNSTLQREPERLEALARHGVLVQVTARSLLSGKDSRRLATALVEQGVAHVIASDAHGSGAAHRAPRLSEAVDAAILVAPERALWMVTEAPAAILAGEPPPDPPSAPRPRRRGLRRLLGI
jgi:protein-tyrosine phosphatase